MSTVVPTGLPCSITSPTSSPTTSPTGTRGNPFRPISNGYGYRLLFCHLLPVLIEPLLLTIGRGNLPLGTSEGKELPTGNDGRSSTEPANRRRCPGFSLASQHSLQGMAGVLTGRRKYVQWNQEVPCRHFRN